METTLTTAAVNQGGIKKRTAGRPPGEFETDKRLYLKLTDQEYAVLWAAADAERRTLTQFVLARLFMGTRDNPTVKATT